MQRLLLPLLLLICNSWWVNAQPPRRPNVYALVVGVNQYDHPINDSLKYADDDAWHFLQFIKKGYAGNIKDSNDIKELINVDATMAKIITAQKFWLDSVAGRMDQGDVLYVYWAGHGQVGPVDHILICKDTKPRPDGMGDLLTKVATKDLKNTLRNIAQIPNVNVLLIIDACRNNSVSHMDNANAIDEIESKHNPGEIYMFACHGNQYSYEADNLQQGVFTHFLLMGLQGAADSDEMDNKVTLQELNEWLPNKVSKYVRKVLAKKLAKDIKQNIVVGLGDPDRQSDIVLSIVPPRVADLHKRQARWFDSVFQATPTDTNFSSLSFRSRSMSMPKKFISYNDDPAYQVPITKDSVHGFYNSFVLALQRRQLIAPAHHSAADFFDSLMLYYPKSKQAGMARVDLFTALIESVQTLVDQYLDGKLIDTRKEVFENSLGELQRALSLVPPKNSFASDFDPYMKFLKARSLAGSNRPSDWTSGMQIIETAIAKNPGNAYMYHTMGLLFYNKSRYFSAIKFLDSALKYAPEWTFAYYNIAASYFKIQEYDLALKYCDSIILLDSKFSRAYSLKAAIIEGITDISKHTDYGDAIAFNEKALSLNAGNTTALCNLGRIFSKTLTNREENIRLAKQYFRLGASLRDENCMAMLGKTLFDQGPAHYDSAMIYFRLAMTINEFNINTLSYYSLLLDSTAAEEIFGRVLQSSENDYKIRNVYRSYVFRNYSTRLADKVFEDIVAGNQEDPLIFIDHSRQYEGKDSLVKAKRILQRGLDYIPNSPSLLFNLSKLQYKLIAIEGNKALDSAVYFAQLLKEKQPNYSLNNYNLFYFGSMQERRDSSLLRSAQQQNSQVGKAGTINKYYLQDQGDSLLQKRDYRGAIVEYQLAVKLLPHERDIQLKLANAYYLDQQLNNAKKHCTLAGEFFYEDLSTYYLTVADSAYIERQKQLAGLIELERHRKRSYQRARLLFDILDQEFRKDPNYLEQAVCLYAANKNRAARVKALSNKKDRVGIFHKMIAQEGKLYSPFFIKQLRSLVNSIEREFFQQ